MSDPKNILTDCAERVERYLRSEGCIPVERLVSDYGRTVKVVFHRVDMPTQLFVIPVQEVYYELDGDGQPCNIEVLSIADSPWFRNHLKVEFACQTPK